MVRQQERRRGRRLLRWSVAEVYPEHDAGLHQTPTNKASFTPTTSRSHRRTEQHVISMRHGWLSLLICLCCVCIAGKPNVSNMSSRGN